MATQKALMLEAVQQPIALGERRVPEPQGGEILIKTTVVGINPYDWRARDWGLFVEGKLPLVLGNDIAGVVEKVGSGVTRFKKGDRIFGQTNFIKRNSDQCGLQEYAILEEIASAKVPSSLTDDHVVCLPCNLVASFWAFFTEEGFNFLAPFSEEAKPLDLSSETIVIIGAGSSCGKYGIQCSALAGFGRIIAVADKTKNEKILLEYGATHVVDRKGTDAEQAERIRAIVGDELLYAFDAFNLEHTLGVSVLSSTKKGKLVTLVPGQPDPSKLGEKKAGFEDKFSSGVSHKYPEFSANFWSHLPGLLEEGKIKATGWNEDIIKGLDADAVNKVLDDYRDGRWPSAQVHVHV
jgi:NADPH2:quinone reductase